MSQPNIGWLFYKQYYWSKIPNKRALRIEDLLKKNEGNSKAFKERNNTITRQKYWSSQDHFAKGKQTIVLRTTYPGLVLGTGYTHETGSEGEFKIGFHFDHTTGLPIIPGSSVKGTIRSMFPNRTEKHRAAKTAYILDMLHTITGDATIESTDVSKLEDEIFEGKREDKRLEEGVYGQDTFHDAYISRGGQSGKILAEDFITPHYGGEDKPEALLKNPIPLMFLKVLPNVEFTFNFDLKDSKIITNLTADHKKKLFEAILKDIGIGAKTNVGYGQFQ